MRTDLWAQFGDQVAGPYRYLATVMAHNADGTASIATAEGYSTRVLGRLDGSVPPYNVWVAQGRVVEQAPSFPLTDVVV